MSGTLPKLSTIYFFNRSVDEYFSEQYYDDFGYYHKLLVDRLLSQSYKVNRLRNSFKKCYSRYPDLAAKYQKSVRDK